MKNKSLSKNAILNGLKTLCSILFPFISFSYCSRVLGADKLGQYSFGQSIIAYLLLLAGLGVTNYAVREGISKKNSINDLNKFIDEVFTINIISTFFSYVVLIILLVFVAKFDAYKYVIIIQSIQVLITTLGTDWVNIIFEDYLYLTIRYVVIQIVSLILLLLFVNDSSDIYIYTIITVLANCGGYVMNWFYLRRRGIKVSVTKKVNIKKHIVPIMVLFANSIASVIYLNSDITMLGLFTSDSDVGIYTVSSKIYSMLKTLINAIILVTLPRFSSYIAENKIKEYRKALSTVSSILVLLTFPISTGLILKAKEIIILIAGKNYIAGEVVVNILSVSTIFAVGACFFSYSILIPNKKEKYFLYSTITAAIINIILNILLIPIYGINAAAFTTLLAEIVVFSITCYYSFKIIKFKVNYLDFIKVILACLLLYIGILLLDYLLDFSMIITFIIEVLCSILLYFLILILFKHSIISDLCNKYVLKRGVKNNG